MKKTFFTLMLLAVATIVTAQSLRFELDGTIYEDGQTIIAPFDADMGEYLQHMHIRNLSDEDINVVMKQSLVEGAQGALVYMCWGLCFNPSDTIISRPVVVAAQTLSLEDLSFHVTFTEGETGVVSVKYEAYDERHPENTISLILLAGNGANVADHTLSMGHAYPNPASSMVHFDLKGNSSEAINVVVYNLLGQEVKSQSVGGGQNRVNISVEDLQPGIYFCNFIANGEVLKTEKFIVKK